MMRILIVDDHGIVREGLRSLIEKQSDMEVIAEAEDGLTAVRLAKELQPDVVIMDVTMPRLGGIEATRMILRNAPGTKIIALSMHAESHIAREILSAGAFGYVLKSYLFEELSRALHAAAAGERYLSPRITDLMVHEWLGQQNNATAGLESELTSRERRILKLTAEGKTIKEIAFELEISPKTAHANRRRLMDKLDISTIAELTKYAIRQGLTAVDF